MHFEGEETMKLIFFGATGMVGAGALQEALNSPDVEAVLSIGRRKSGVSHSKLCELEMKDLSDLSGVEEKLKGYDGCIWAIGITSMGMEEAEYARVTEELTLLWARELLRLNPEISFCYCSAAGAGGNMMWARVRQRVEAALQGMPFKHAGAVRPGFIRPEAGIRSRVKAYQAMITLFRPVFPICLRLFPGGFTTGERLGRAMLRVTQGKADRFILESVDINRVGA